jgi:hypothetical protein
VRFPGGLFQLLATGKKGAIMERTDAQLHVPSVLQDVLELPFPITANLLPSTGVQEGSFGDFITIARAGVQVPTVFQSIGTLAAGVWTIRGMLAFFFTGTTNTASFTFFGPNTDTSGTTTPSPWIVLTHMNLNSQIIVPFSHTLHLVKPAIMQVNVPAIVAADVHQMSVAFNAGRIL